MIQKATLAALMTAALTLPAIAGDAPSTAAAAPAADPNMFLAERAHNANANAVRAILQSRGYTQVYDLNRDEDGRWTGSGLKDGKRVLVKLTLPTKVYDPILTN